MALKVADIEYEHREVSLKNKPAHMLEISPKGTVPVMLLSDGTVLEESLDIMHWSLRQNDPCGMIPRCEKTRAEIENLIDRNDHEFKHDLDRYKYHVRFGEESRQVWREQGETFLAELEKILTQQRFLFAEYPTLADLAIFPFVRQFAHVDSDWFATKPYPKVFEWYQYWIQSDLFAGVMGKHTLWQE